MLDLGRLRSVQASATSVMRQVDCLQASWLGSRLPIADPDLFQVPAADHELQMARSVDSSLTSRIAVISPVPLGGLIFGKLAGGGADLQTSSESWLRANSPCFPWAARLAPRLRAFPPMSNRTAESLPRTQPR